MRQCDRGFSLTTFLVIDDDDHGTHSLAYPAETRMDRAERQSENPRGLFPVEALKPDQQRCHPFVLRAFEHRFRAQRPPTTRVALIADHYMQREPGHMQREPGARRGPLAAVLLGPPIPQISPRRALAGRMAQFANRMRGTRCA
jgi:hypothetical protein